jgi:predicted N-formylglutamate amidohydrolase
MDAARLARLAPSNAVKVTNRHGSSRYVIVCDHASNFIPQEYGTLGLEPAALTRHIAWDPGALPVAQRLAAALDAPLVESCISRLVIDCNRPLDAPDLMVAVTVSEKTVIPGNQGLSLKEREARIALSWQPFHDTIEALVEARLAAGQPTWLISVHSFTPMFKGIWRPWHIGIIHDADTRLATPLIAALKRLDGVTVGINEPYSPADRVYYTLERHARSRGLPCAMIEIRNDEISEERDQLLWGGRLGDILAGLAKRPEHKKEAETAKADVFDVRQMTSRGR